MATPSIPSDVNADKRAKLAQLLNSGVITPDAVAPQVLQGLGLGPAAKPITASINDRVVDPTTGRIILDAAQQYSETPQYDQSGKAFVLDKSGNMKYLDGVQARTKIDVSNGTAYDPYNTAPGTTFAPQPEAPMSPERYKQEGNLAASRAAASAAKGNWQILTDPSTNKQYRYDLTSGTALTLDGQPYVPGGAGKIASGQARSAAALAAQRYVAEHPDATAEDVAQFAADFGKTVKSVSAFSTGKQGDLIRSFNVGISHLNTLDGLVGALNNGDIQTFNKLGNAIAQETGKPAPTNFDAAKAIVGDEIIKAIVGGGGALADRENAQNQINRANSPAQLRGVISTYKELMAGQLRGLKKQYTDTTGRNDFDERLAPETKIELEGGSNSATDALLKKYGIK
jgi:hypothetical protein